MFFHGGDQGFLGHAQEVVVETAGQGHRPLHQGGDLVEQILVQMGLAAGVAAGLLGLLANHFPAAREVGDHLAVLLQAAGVIARLAQLDGVRRVETVAPGGSPGTLIE